MREPGSSLVRCYRLPRLSCVGGSDDAVAAAAVVDEGSPLFAGDGHGLVGDVAMAAEPPPAEKRDCPRCRRRRRHQHCAHLPRHQLPDHPLRAGGWPFRCLPAVASWLDTEAPWRGPRLGRRDAVLAAWPARPVITSGPFRAGPHARGSTQGLVLSGRYRPASHKTSAEGVPLGGIFRSAQVARKCQRTR
jgi:hypothetical protein